MYEVGVEVGGGVGSEIPEKSDSDNKKGLPSSASSLENKQQGGGSAWAENDRLLFGSRDDPVQVSACVCAYLL